MRVCFSVSRLGLSGLNELDRVTMSTKSKAEVEFGYWSDRFEKEGGALFNGHYERLMTACTGLAKESFQGKVVCDFGSGPRGSLEWADLVKERICADILIEQYRSLGIENHKARYLKTTEDRIPLDDNYCDITLTINSIDHCDNLPLMCDELVRITKTGGVIGGSVALNEPWTAAEPNTLTESQFREILVDRLDIDHYLVGPKFKGPFNGRSNNYRFMFEMVENGKPTPFVNQNSEQYLWFSGRKR